MKYNNIPIIIPKNKYARTSPLLIIKIANNNMIAAISINIISCIYVIKSEFLKHFLIILNTSNNIPSISPTKTKNRNFESSFNIKLNFYPFPI